MYSVELAETCVGGGRGQGVQATIFSPSVMFFYNIHRGGENKSVGWCAVQINTVVKT